MVVRELQIKNAPACENGQAAGRRVPGTGEDSGKVNLPPVLWEGNWSSCSSCSGKPAAFWKVKRRPASPGVGGTLEKGKLLVYKNPHANVPRGLIHSYAKLATTQTPLNP